MSTQRKYKRTHAMSSAPLCSRPLAGAGAGVCEPASVALGGCPPTGRWYNIRLNRRQIGVNRELSWALTNICFIQQSIAYHSGLTAAFCFDFHFGANREMEISQLTYNPKSHEYRKGCTPSICGVSRPTKLLKANRRCPSKSGTSSAQKCANQLGLVIDAEGSETNSSQP